MAYLALIIRTDGIEKPNDLEPDSKAFILLESIETETERFFKLRTGTEEFWNRTSTTSIWVKSEFSQILRKLPLKGLVYGSKVNFCKFYGN